MGKTRPEMNGIMMRRMAACCMALVTTAAGCHRPDDYLLGPSQADEVLVVTAVRDDPAGGRHFAGDDHRAARSAHRRGQANPDVHHHGRHTELAGGKEGLSITAPADTSGKAVVELRSSTTAGDGPARR